MEKSFEFVSLCPNCGQPTRHDAYSYAELRTLLGAGAPIEAYCMACDQVWPTSRKERVEIARRLAAEEILSPLRPRAVRAHVVSRQRAR